MNASIQDIVILNAEIIGNSHVGILVGSTMLPSNGNTISNVVILGSDVKGDKYVGGVVGSIYTGKNLLYQGSVAHNVYNNIIKGCNVNAIVQANDCAGGLIGLATGGWYNWYESSYSWGRGTGDEYILSLFDNYSDCIIQSKGKAGGIIAYTEGWYWVNTDSYRRHWLELMFKIERNISTGSIKGSGSVCGIVGSIQPAFDNEEYFSTTILQNNIAAIDTICNTENKLYRITHRPYPNNYAFVNTIGLFNSSSISFEDDDFNGLSYGLKTLKRKTTYEGMGFDFNNQWRMIEGETFPYNINQSTPPEIISFESGTKSRIIGKSDKDGTIYVFVNGTMFESPIIDGQWQVNLGNIALGTKAKVSARTDMAMPSICICSYAKQNLPVEPDLFGGDANGDGTVDAADVVSIINYILGKPSSSFNEKNADINGDGQILVDDAVGTVNKIMSNQ